MPPVTTQAQVIERLTTNRQQLEKQISNFSAEEMTLPTRIQSLCTRRH
jgi:hypothetical protein